MANESKKIKKNCVWEFCFFSETKYVDPYNEVMLDVIFTDPNENKLRVPAFWDGGNKWLARFAAEQVGKYTFKSVCSNAEDKGLHEQIGAITVEPYTGVNLLLQHGRLQASEDKSHFVHTDGAQFFWLGDTWWMGLTERLDWPKGFKELTEDREKKGFNIVQIVAGLYPEMELWDSRGRNEAGFPFEKDFACINPEFYKHADLKIRHLVESGLVPCIVGSWGYYLQVLGVEKIKKYWRYLVARYGAYPVVWCIAGEGTMPYYLSETRKKDEEFQKRSLFEVASYVKKLDPFGNLLSVHSPLFDPKTSDTPHGISTSGNARDIDNGTELFDFEMLQTGHGGFDSLPRVISEVNKAVSRKPKVPVVNSEINYEGILGMSWQDVQRLSFYISLFNGVAGYTYGANGIMQFNTKDHPFGPSPHGMNWGNISWEEAAKFPGAAQVALGGKFIMEFPWWELEKHQEWVECDNQESDWHSVLCLGITGKTRLIYVPQLWVPPLIKEIESNVTYNAYYFDPCTGSKHNIGEVDADDSGDWKPPFPPEIHDWIIVLESE